MAKKKKTKKKGKMQFRVSRPRKGFPSLRSQSGLSDMEPPPGFRAISSTQATMEYVKPLMELHKEGVDMNVAMNLGMMFWNYSLGTREKLNDEKTKKDTIKVIKKTLKLDKTEAEKLLTEMVDRFHYLFPADIQPESGFYMFMRKEKQQELKSIDPDQLVLSERIIPADAEDTTFIDRLKELDNQVLSRVGIDAYEKLYLSVMNETEEVFSRWLEAKECKINAGELSSCLPIYFKFIYGYECDTLKSVSESALRGFFSDFLLRKMIADPEDYLYWPPALKHFYRFLQEKGYLDDPGSIIEKIERMEVPFLEILKNQFS